jgi:quercetin dioxygenase-like cupin family protein
MHTPNTSLVQLPLARSVNELLQYQEQAVVSRVLLKNAGGTVTLFAFDQDEGLSDHAVPFDALVVAVEGSAEIDIAGEIVRVEQGEMINLPAQVRHAVRATRPFKMLLIMLRA